MGLMKRFSEVMKAKTSKMLDKAEDPRETLDYSYEKQLEMVQKVRRGLADVATSRKRLELQQTQLKASADKLEQQARTAVGVGKEDLAQGSLYPALPRIREVSLGIAVAVADVAYQRGLADGPAPNDVTGLVRSQMYEPRY